MTPYKPTPAASTATTTTTSTTVTTSSIPTTTTATKSTTLSPLRKHFSLTLYQTSKFWTYPD